MTIYAKSSTIKKFTKECFELNEETGLNELSFAKIFNVTEKEFEESLNYEAAFSENYPVHRAATKIVGTVLTAHYYDSPKELFEQYQIVFRTKWSSAITVARETARRYQCGVVLDSEEPGLYIDNGFGCHYNPASEYKITVDFEYVKLSIPDYMGMNLPG
jgi:hypothetical protein